MNKNYETVLILSPSLSEDQAKDAVEKFVKVLTEQECQIINTEHWGLRELAYEIQHRKTGYYGLIEFTAPPQALRVLETEYRRDERVIRFLTTALDKHAVAYNEKRRQGGFKKIVPDTVQQIVAATAPPPRVVESRDDRRGDRRGDRDRGDRQGGGDRQAAPQAAPQAAEPAAAV